MLAAQKQAEIIHNVSGALDKYESKLSEINLKAIYRSGPTPNFHSESIAPTTTSANFSSHSGMDTRLTEKRMELKRHLK
ncbi:unnamed protein product [Penicillium roqueforti FM164]|uniref:Genomic scaffold, ProqFM164S03 n=1 Tax=Penicillium roqueforti (strain FM164) TaxID=1365484 RepID=W6QCS8_PENRF|nr:unnamed protein product [Penicillium roqueforti FM164]